MVLAPSGNMSEDNTIRPGFNLDCTFRGHTAPVRSVLYNPTQKSFLSLDDRSLKSWTKERDGSTKLLHDQLFPGFQQNFVACMALAPNINMVFCACLDDTLKIYNERLRLKSSLAWMNGVVREMIYNVKRNELITAGSYGVKVGGQGIGGGWPSNACKRPPQHVHCLSPDRACPRLPNRCGNASWTMRLSALIR